MRTLLATMRKYTAKRTELEKSINLITVFIHNNLLMINNINNKIIRRRYISTCSSAGVHGLLPESMNSSVFNEIHSPIIRGMSKQGLSY